MSIATFDLYHTRNDQIPVLQFSGYVDDSTYRLVRLEIKCSYTASRCFL